MSSGRGSGQPHPIDVQVGARVRSRRNALGLSQEKLAEALGLTFQQVQKYERGSNRISASRLYHLSRVLTAPIESFFDDADAAAAGATGFSEPASDAFDSDPMHRRETAELIDAYFAIDDAAVRRRLLDLAKALATDAGEAATTRRRGRRKDRT